MSDYRIGLQINNRDRIVVHIARVRKATIGRDLHVPGCTSQTDRCCHSIRCCVNHRKRVSGMARNNNLGAVGSSSKAMWVPAHGDGGYHCVCSRRNFRDGVAGVIGYIHCCAIGSNGDATRCASDSHCCDLGVIRQIEDSN